ncbi:hypothetical protein C6A37_00545, partial [Desulfobacteraceae bacterium SEEP-SAG9]
KRNTPLLRCIEIKCVYPGLISNRTCYLKIFSIRRKKIKIMVTVHGAQGSTRDLFLKLIPVLFNRVMIWLAQF